MVFPLSPHCFLLLVLTSLMISNQIYHWQPISPWMYHRPETQHLDPWIFAKPANLVYSLNHLVTPPFIQSLKPVVTWEASSYPFFISNSVLHLGSFYFQGLTLFLISSITHRRNIILVPPEFLEVLSLAQFFSSLDSVSRWFHTFSELLFPTCTSNISIKLLQYKTNPIAKTEYIFFSKNLLLLLLHSVFG